MSTQDPEIRAKRAERRATQANRRADEAQRALALMRARAEGAEQARDEARAALAPLQEEIARLCDPEMTDLRLADGGINLRVAGPIVERLALAMAGYVRGDGTGPGNYTELHVHARSEPFERYVVTVQRSDRPSPHELRMQAERRHAELLCAYQEQTSHIRGLTDRLAAMEQDPAGSGF